MRNGEGMELAIERKDLDAMRGSLIFALARPSADMSIMKGMISSMLNHMDIEGLAAWYKDSTGDEPPVIDVEGWVEAWKKICRET